jgi:hypothetical protein
VAALIEAWALDLEGGPAAPPAVAGQTITAVHVTSGPAGGSTTLTVEREGAIVVADSQYPDQASYQRYVDDQRDTFADAGPSLRHPTAAWLAALDPSPGNLRPLVSASCDCAAAPALMFATVEELLGRADLVLPPRVRAGLLRVLATIPGITAYEATVDGRPYRVVALEGPTAARELFIDPLTRRFAGAAFLITGRAPDLPQCQTPSNPADRTAQPRPTGAECQEVVTLDQPARESVTVWEQTLVTP